MYPRSDRTRRRIQPFPPSPEAACIGPQRIHTTATHTHTPATFSHLLPPSPAVAAPPRKNPPFPARPASAAPHPTAQTPETSTPQRAFQIPRPSCLPGWGRRACDQAAPSASVDTSCVQAGVGAGAIRPWRAGQGHGTSVDWTCWLFDVGTPGGRRIGDCCRRVAGRVFLWVVDEGFACRYGGGELGAGDEGRGFVGCEAGHAD